MKPDLDAKKTSIYFRGPARTELERRQSAARGWTPIVNDIVERYAAIMRGHAHEDTVEGWDFYRNALRSWEPDLADLEASVIDRLEHHAAAVGFKADGFIRHVRGFSYASLLSLVDAVERYWAAYERGGA